MVCLNWSLKLHIRLRTILLLISTHIAHVYVQWMSYSFMWLYLIKCVFTCSISVNQPQKEFWVFSYFWKVFCFYKNCQNFKNNVTLFWQLSHGLIQSYVPVTSPHINFSWLTGGSMSQSWKILSIFFKIWVFNVSRGSVWRLVHGWRFQLRRYSEIFATYLATLSRVELPVTKNT